MDPDFPERALAFMDLIASDTEAGLAFWLVLSTAVFLGAFLIGTVLAAVVLAGGAGLADFAATGLELFCAGVAFETTLTGLAGVLGAGLVTFLTEGADFLSGALVFGTLFVALATFDFAETGFFAFGSFFTGLAGGLALAG